MTNGELLVKLTETEARARRNEGRIRDLESGQEALRRLATAVEVLANEQRHQTGRLASLQNDLQALGGKVDSLEQKPGRRWEAAAEKALLVVISAVITFLLARLGLGG